MRKPVVITIPLHRPSHSLSLFLSLLFAILIVGVAVERATHSWPRVVASEAPV